MSGREVRGTRWQRFCGWLAVVTAVIWAVKFALLASVTGEPVAVVGAFTGFLAPSLGSVLGLVAALGVVAPVVGGRPWWVAVPASVVVGLAAVAAISGLSNATARLPFVVESSSPVLRAEAPILTTALLYAVLAVWLLRPRLESPLAALALTLGGALWLVKGVAVAGGAARSGWVVATYQVGLWSLLVAAVWLVARELRGRRYASVAVGLGVVVVTQLVGAVPVLGGELGLLTLAGVALALGVVLWRGERSPGRYRGAAWG